MSYVTVQTNIFLYSRYFSQRLSAYGKDAMKFTLALAFFFTAAVYASVGFGGGSTYTALLAVSDTPYVIIPVVSLICNICVVSGNSWRYLRKKIITFRETWPLFVLSVPAALLGGMLQVSEVLFIGLLSLALLISGIRMIFSKSQTDLAPVLKLKANSVMSGLIGGMIGFYSGIVGIGGGIFLAPILYRLKWASGHQIAATCSIFILVNSTAGLLGQLTKSWSSESSLEILQYWPLILAVFMGGTIGNMLSIKRLKVDYLRRVTGVLILIVAIRLLFKWVDMIS